MSNLEQGGSQGFSTSGGAILVTTRTNLTASTPSSATVGIVSSQVVASNASRKGLELVNTSNNIISIAFGSPAVLNSGITLNPYGGAFNMDEYTYTTSAVNAIASSANSNLAIQEYI